MSRFLALAALALLLTACASMNRAVGVLPNTLDDLGQKSADVNGNDEAQNE